MTHPGNAAAAAAATAAAEAAAVAPVATNGAVATPMKFSTNFSRTRPGAVRDARASSSPVPYAKHGYENILDDRRSRGIKATSSEEQCDSSAAFEMKVHRAFHVSRNP